MLLIDLTRLFFFKYFVVQFFLIWSKTFFKCNTSIAISETVTMFNPSSFLLLTLFCCTMSIVVLVQHMNSHVSIIIMLHEVSIWSFFTCRQFISFKLLFFKFLFPVFLFCFLSYKGTCWLPKFSLQLPVYLSLFINQIFWFFMFLRSLWRNSGW